jgi:hypothetical protein
MKNTFFVALMAFVCSLSACADNDQLISFAQLPTQAQATVKQYFNEANVAYCTMDRELFGKEYKVQFNDGTEIKFEGNGTIHKVDCKFYAVPDALIPEIVRQQVSAQFPQAIIVEWGKDDWGWKAELNNQLELKFNSKYQMMGVDD